MFSADYVTATEGTGLVHTAPAFGEDDYQRGLQFGLPFFLTVDEEGKIVERARNRGLCRARGSRMPTNRSFEISRAGSAAASRSVSAQLSLLLALRPAVGLLRQQELVLSVLPRATGADRSQSDDRLAPGAHQGWAIRKLAGERCRLGPVTKQILGNSSAGMALRQLLPHVEVVGSFEPALRSCRP